MSDRLWDKVAMGPGCWPFMGARSPKGYGTLNWREGGRQVARSAHRMVWERLYGPIPKGMYVLHICDNPPCVKPTHLRLGSPADNMHDMAAKGRGHWQKAAR